MEDTIGQAMQLGAMLDGPIKYPLHGKVRDIDMGLGYMM